MSEQDLLALAVERVEPALGELFDRLGAHRETDGPAEGHRVPARLLEAMRYAALSPGKRLRPALVLGGAMAVHARIEDALPAACAVEMVHAYSLVHDDLPIMDDDDQRRGRAACHRKFDEATALLAGDALLTEALTLVASGDPLGGGERVPAPRCARATATLGRAIGAAGMVGGQLDDLAGSKDLASIHRRKTGRLIMASAVLGAIYGGGTADDVNALRTFGAELGLAFQLVDDLLDGDGVAARSREEAQKFAASSTKRAIAAIDHLGAKGASLTRLAERMLERTG